MSQQAGLAGIQDIGNHGVAGLVYRQLVDNYLVVIAFITIMVHSSS